MQGDTQFRVKLILGQYFADHKANSYICVNRHWKTVKDLHLHIKHLFDIDGFVLKTTENVYLPDQENINVIQPGDDISAMPCVIAKNGAKVASVNKIRPDNLTKSSDSFNPFSQPKSSTDKDPTHMDLNASEKHLKPPNSNDANGLLDLHRRKRTRKHKNKNDSKEKNRTDSNGGDTSVSELSPKIKSSKLVTVSAEGKRNGTNKPTANKHVRFDDDGLESEQDDEVDLPKKARIVSANVAGEVTFRVPTIATEPEVEILETTLMEATVIENPNSEAVISDHQEETTVAEPESALEQLAKNLETVGKYKELIEEAKPNDIIAFKVFTPNFEKSSYVIGLVESINTRNNPNDYDLILTIMAGSVHIKHLTEFDENNANQNIQIGINRMDLFDAKIIEL